jgi:[ribosomal protein S18]-alanine N-acetyltransferase
LTKYVVRPMRFDDIDAVGEVERECFSTPWPSSAYRRELRDNRLGRYIVLVEVRDPDAPARHEAAPPDDPPTGVIRAMGQLLRPFGRPSATLSPSNERIVGFAGMWLMLDEAHVTTIGVKRELRGLGLGEMLFATLLQIAIEVGAHRSTLEVRISNHSAQALYRKYGFHDEGVRRRYYSDNNEDALIMWSDRLESPGFRKLYGELRADLSQRLGEMVEIRT